MDSPVEEPALSLEQMKSNLFQKFQREGTIDQIRVQLRTSFVQTLQKASHAAAVSATPNLQEWTVVEKVANSMIYQYLQTKQLKHTLSVFLPEVGPRNCDLQQDMIHKLLRHPAVPTIDVNENASSPLWLLDMLREKEQRADVITHDNQTQTIGDDHRFLLETELKRIDDLYWNQCMLQKAQSHQSFDEQLVAFQHEYDARSQAQMQKEIERIRDMEISLMRMEERKFYAKEMDDLRASLQAEYATKAQSLADTEARLRIEFAEHRQQLDSDMFELRQTLLRELDNVRSKERQLLSSIDLEAMKSANEARRLALLESNLTQRERQLDQTLKEVQEEREGQLRRVMEDADAKVHAQTTALQAMQRQLEKESQQLRESQGEFTAMAQRVAVVEGQLAAARGLHMDQKMKLEQLERERMHVDELLTASRASQVEISTKENAAIVALAHAKDTIARLERETKAERAVFASQLAEKTAAVQDALAQAHAAQTELARLKVDHADAIVSVKHAAYDAMAAERRSAKQAEDALHVQLQDLQNRCSDVEAQCHRYRTQCEDEQVHVASLRHEIASLNALLNTLKYTSPVASVPASGFSRRLPSWMPAADDSDGSRMMGAPARRAVDLDDARLFEEWKQERRGGQLHIDMPSFVASGGTTSSPPQRALINQSAASDDIRSSPATADNYSGRRKQVDEEEDVTRQRQLEEERDRAAVLERQRQEQELEAKRELEQRLLEQAAARAAMEAQLKASQDAFDRQLLAQEKAKNEVIQRLRLEADAKQAQDERKRQADARDIEARRAADAAAVQAEMAAKEEARLLEDKHVKEELARQLQEAQDQLSRQAIAIAPGGTSQNPSNHAPSSLSGKTNGGTDISSTVSHPSADSDACVRQMTLLDEDRRHEERAIEEDRMEAAVHEKLDREQLEKDRMHADEVERLEAAARAEEKARLDEADKRKTAEAAAENAAEEARQQAVAAQQKLLDDERNAKEQQHENQKRLEKELRASQVLQEQERAEAQQREEEAAKQKAQEEEKEAARLKQEAESKDVQEQKQDLNIIDEYRQRAIARRAEKLRLEQEAKAKELAQAREEAERKQREEDEAAAAAATEEVGSESGDSVLSVGGVGSDKSGDASGDSF
ncbi:hypothetical protein, variant 1 [Aphanomyces invadans]|uniref:Uncharacterized protein n=1 Tax=Aphanomyces invadans TaxID=157072 RepID=A0A024UGL9_9STRA|nr:hypothetical protein, variant 1 [Aphanomyces invadans]ETW05566.1 hypothetical protein, variant 1 [Aphanomyces invadans]|eukprot:XP_008865343.1 hypothetical protein, variant 1 [Aphanomyces invadans]